MIPLLLLLAVGAASAGVFPYQVRKQTLPNGLDVVVIETPEFKDVLSFNTMVLAGSGREYEKGRTGLAHLFEHILFRHRHGGVEGGYDATMDRLGTHNNAWTSFDVTYYHPLTFTSNLEKGGAKGELPGLLELEAARFSRLDVSEKTFKTETGAVLGEYRKASAQPWLKMEEKLLELLYPGRAYGHSTLGFYEDIADMPNQYASAMRFYKDWYRPDNCMLVVAGDVKAEDLFPKIAARYAGWKRTAAPIAPAPPPLPRGGKRARLAWDSDVAPLAWVAYRMPAFDPASRESGAAELLPELLASPTAPLFRKLRYDKRTVSALDLSARAYESFDPRFLVVETELYKDKYKEKGDAYVSDVIADVVAGLDDLKSYSKKPGAEAELAALKSKFRWDFLRQLSSPESIASAFASFYRFRQDPQAIDRLIAAVDAVTPADVEALARERFVPEERAVLTLAYEAKK